MARNERRWRRGAAVLLLAGSVAACGAAGDKGGRAMTGAELTGTSWLAEDIDGRGVIDNAQSTLDFREGGQVSGGTACNRFMGQATISSDRLAFGSLATTRRACPPALMDQEQRFLQALAATQRFTLEGPYLRFLDAGGRPLVTFTRTPSPS